MKSSRKSSAANLPAAWPPDRDRAGGEPEPETTARQAGPVASDGRAGNPGFGDDLWAKARAYWDECHCIRKTAEKFGLSPNSVKTRARREGWRK